jgi:hypothetical protein
MNKKVRNLSLTNEELELLYSALTLFENFVVENEELELISNIQQKMYEICLIEPKS